VLIDTDRVSQRGQQGLCGVGDAGAVAGRREQDCEFVAANAGEHRTVAIRAGVQVRCHRGRSNTLMPTVLDHPFHMGSSIPVAYDPTLVAAVRRREKRDTATSLR
jgi:hypothetical protein